MKILTVLALLVGVNAFGTMNVYDQDSSRVGRANHIECPASHDCSISGRKMLMRAYRNIESVSGSSNTLTIANCGSIVRNTAAASIVLPEASTALGCEYYFVVGSGQAHVDPADGTDQILVETNSAGDAITNSTAGNTIILQAVEDDSWVSIGTVGTWADAN